ncbi:peptidase U32 family protein [Thermoproteota archaeon]
MKPELVVPAGDFNSLKAAVCNDADAVYLGGKKFNARIHARNFGLDELQYAIPYAHDHNVKIYVAVNTLIADRELSDIDEYLTNLDRLEVDAVILQDLGALKLCKDLHSGLKIHASTQSTVFNSTSVKFWENHGANRVILARELSINEIQKIKSENNIELEVFIHGALCFSFSGQCLLSSFIGERSANRGRCASPCRLPYSIITNKGIPIKTDGPHLLSMKDLNLSEDIGKLVLAGVDALKIEGRMKTPEYVAVVTEIYRKIIDDNYRQPTQSEKRDLEKIFNREFTKGGLYNSQGYEAINQKRPINNGIEIGVVTGYDISLNTVKILLSDEIQVGDGLEFQTSSGRQGFIITNMFVDGQNCNIVNSKSIVEILLLFQPLDNSIVRKTRDIALYDHARKTFSQAKNILSTNNSDLHFIHQKGYERLSSILLTPGKKQEPIIPKICVELDSLESLKESIRAGVDEIYFGGSFKSSIKLDIDNYQEALDAAKENNVPITIMLPRVMRENEFLKKLVLSLNKVGATSFLVSDIGALELVRQLGFKTYLDSSLNVFNRITRNLLFNYAKRITLSTELHISQIARISGGAPGEIELIAHGPITLMLSEYCPISNVLNHKDKSTCKNNCNENGFFLKDHQDLLYTIKCDEISNTHIISPNDLCLIEHLPKLRTLGVDIFRITSHFYSPKVTTELIKLYKKALFINIDDIENKETLTSLKEKILKISKRKFSEGKLMTGVE